MNSGDVWWQLSFWHHHVNSTVRSVSELISGFTKICLPSFLVFPPVNISTSYIKCCFFLYTRHVCSKQTSYQILCIVYFGKEQFFFFVFKFVYKRQEVKLRQNIFFLKIHIDCGSKSQFWLSSLQQIIYSTGRI